MYNKTWFFLAAAAVVGLIGCGKLAPPTPRGETLYYEIESVTSVKPTAAETARLLDAVQRRLDSVGYRLGLATKTDDGRIAVALMHRDDADRLAVERLLARGGRLEFRILANYRDNKELIEKALAKPHETEVRDEKGKLLAWWARICEPDELGIEQDANIAKRREKSGGRGFNEVLAINDAYNVTNEYILSARPSTDRTGRPCVNLTFNGEGGRLFGELTTEFKPVPAGGGRVDHTYRLAIILDGMVRSAPLIQSPIFSEAEITGSFTDEEVKDICRMLNGGSLPARLRLDEVKMPANQP
jgi:preprotein translocase subunit SecD